MKLGVSLGLEKRKENVFWRVSIFFTLFSLAFTPLIQQGRHGCRVPL